MSIEATMARAKTVELQRPSVSSPHPTNLASEILTSLRYRLGKDASVATQHDWLAASISVVYFPTLAAPLRLARR